MADYTIKNLKQLEDSAVTFGLAPNIEARFASRALECKDTGLSYQRIEPNFRMPFGHSHKQQEEIYVLLSGSARIKLDDEVVDLAPWDAVRVSKGTTRAFEAGPEGAEFLAFGAPQVGPGDAEMTPGWWSN
jgi:mannose-6-phosphate isomerase-like protein (cupin superfamily)